MSMEQKSKRLERGAGILLPISSLPSPYGIGSLGKEAYHFVDQLEDAGQKYWQVLPVGPTSFGDSPYQSFSTFAGNPYFIDLDLLQKEGLLEKEEIQKIDWGELVYDVDYQKMYVNRFGILKKAFLRWKEKSSSDYQDFVHKNQEWLGDYSLFMSCKDYFGGVEWLAWNEDIRCRKETALEYYRQLLKEKMEFWCFVQYQFFEQWNALKKYANQKEIQIIGDIPIYVALDSADVWANPGQYQLDETLHPIDVAGCPPDAFSDYGQKWGNPIYDWDIMEKDHFSWWKKRIKAAGSMYDVVRIDHFIGIVRYYAIPAEGIPVDGAFRKGPGEKLIKAIDEAIGDAKVIAEDLGVVVPGVRQLLKKSGYPGMKILEFAFDGKRENEYLPHNYERNCVVYSGTHDNETLLGYFDSLPEEGYQYLLDYTGLYKEEEMRSNKVFDTAENEKFLEISKITKDGKDFDIVENKKYQNKLIDIDFVENKENISNRSCGEFKEQLANAVIRLAYQSVADTVILQMQDILKKDNDARMNLPSTIGQNWRWRLKKGEFGEKEIKLLGKMADIYNR